MGESNECASRYIRYRYNTNRGTNIERYRITKNYVF